MNLNLKTLTIIYGHYGCGKTNLSINLALQSITQGKKVTLVDMDIVNPYFRSSDYRVQLQKKGIEVVCPNFAGTNLDTPSLSPLVYSALEKTDDTCVILDVGGDDAGAYALGRFKDSVEKHGDLDAFYVINKHRNFTTTPYDCSQILSEIESACGIMATGVINNSHLQQLTTAQDIKNCYGFGVETAKLLNLPLVATTAPRSVASDVTDCQNILPVDIIVKPPFDL